MPQPFLAGYRVIDLSQYAPGPYGGQILADLGAHVAKVEPPGGEPMRTMGPVDSDGVSAWYKGMNRGKSVVELNLKSDDGKRAFEALLARADAMLESYRPGVLDRLGFSRARLDELNPRLIHCSLSGWGQTGPYRLKGGHDTNYMSLMGGLAISGDGSAPAMAHPPTADYASGMHAALSINAALLGRDGPRGDGRGRFLDVSIAEAVLPWQMLAFTSERREGFAMERGAALLNGGSAFYHLYETSDGRFVSLGAIELKFWANFCTAVDKPDWIARQAEPLPQSKLTAEVAALFSARSLADWVGILETVDCCFEAIHEIVDTLDHPHIKARGMVHEVGGSEPRVEVSYPAWVDGAPPPAPEPVRFASVDEVLEEWRQIKD
jgi:alpha-methylacyl-CoA racemase